MNPILVRPPAFAYRRLGSRAAVLSCDQVALPLLAKRFGTPLYVYAAAMILGGSAEGYWD